ncbi:ABC transporter permease, partial [Oenococcus oeni]
TYCIPFFVILVLGIWIFGYVLGWFPTTGSVSPTANGTFATIGSRFYHMLLPGILGALFGTVNIVQYLRSEVVDAKSSDYVRTARAKGVPINDIYRHHIFRNSLLPIAAFAGYSITGLLNGAIFTESVFSYPG